MLRNPQAKQRRVPIRARAHAQPPGRGAMRRARTSRRQPPALPVLRPRSPSKRSRSTGKSGLLARITSGGGSGKKGARQATKPLAGLLAGAGVGALAFLKRRRDQQRVDVQQPASPIQPASPAEVRPGGPAGNTDTVIGGPLGGTTPPARP
jgi:hypothetical protein